MQYKKNLPSEKYQLPITANDLGWKQRIHKEEHIQREWQKNQDLHNSSFSGKASYSQKDSLEKLIQYKQKEINEMTPSKYLRSSDDYGKRKYLDSIDDHQRREKDLQIYFMTKNQNCS